MENYDLDYGLHLNEDGEFDGTAIFGLESDDFLQSRKYPEIQWSTPISESEVQRYTLHGIARIFLPRIRPHDLWEGRLDLKPLIAIDPPTFYWRRDRSTLYEGKQKIRDVPARIYIASSKVNPNNLPREGARRFSNGRDLQALWFGLGRSEGLSFWNLRLDPTYA